MYTLKLGIDAFPLLFLHIIKLTNNTEIMKTRNYFYALWFLTVTFLCFCACSSDDEPIEEEEGPTLIETPIPANAEIGVYAIRHDKKNDQCTFKFIFGENPPVDTIVVVLWDWSGKYMGQFFLVAPSHPEYVESDTYVDRWDGIRGYHSDVFTISCYMCESMLGILRYHLPVNLVDEETGETYVQWETIEKKWRPLHHFFE
jgi:hypothetical protein